MRIYFEFFEFIFNCICFYSISPFYLFIYFPLLKNLGFLDFFGFFLMMFLLSGSKSESESLDEEDEDDSDPALLSSSSFLNKLIPSLSINHKINKRFWIWFDFTSEEIFRHRQGIYAALIDEERRYHYKGQEDVVESRCEEVKVHVVPLVVAVRLFVPKRHQLRNPHKQIGKCLSQERRIEPNQFHNKVRHYNLAHDHSNAHNAFKGEVNELIDIKKEWIYFTSNIWKIWLREQTSHTSTIWHRYKR